jgi:hypothetical protein
VRAKRPGERRCQDGVAKMELPRWSCQEYSPKMRDLNYDAEKRRIRLRLIECFPQKRLYARQDAVGCAGNETNHRRWSEFLELG